MRFEIWYMRPEWFAYGIRGKQPFPGTELDRTHVHLKDLELPDDAELEDVFAMMQGENWSPNGEAESLILEKGLNHTSMSVGDIAVVNGRRFMIACFGFTRLTDGEGSNEDGQ